MQNIDRKTIFEVPDDPTSATVDFEVANVSGFIPKGEKLYSEPFLLRGLSWRLMVWRKESSYLGVFLKCEYKPSKSVSWSCKVKATFSLLSKIHRVDNFSRSIEHSFSSMYEDWGYSRFVSWYKVADPFLGYVKNDAVTIRAHVVADNPIIPIGPEITEPASETQTKNDDEVKKKEVSDDITPPVNHPIGAKVTESVSETESENHDAAKKKEVNDDTASTLDDPIGVEATESATETESESDDTASETESESDDAASEIAPKSDNTASKAKSKNDDEVKKEEVNDDIAPAVDHTRTIGSEITEPVPKTESENDDEAKKKEVNDDTAPAADHPVGVEATERELETGPAFSMSRVLHVNVPTRRATKAESPSPAVNESDKDEQKSSEAEVSQLKQELAVEKSKSEIMSVELKAKSQQLEDNRLIISLLQSKVVDLIAINESEKKVSEMSMKLDSLTNVVAQLALKVATLERGQEQK